MNMDTDKNLARALALAAACCAVGACVNERPPCVSGVYPHLAMTNAEGECGTGAVVPWAGSLWAVTYGPHCPNGSTDKLYQISPDLKQTVREESVGGTPADRLIHRESNQLVVGPYFIDAKGSVRVIPPERMPGRLTGAARHLTDPEHKVYVATMDNGLYEVDVGSLAVRTLLRDHNGEVGKVWGNKKPTIPHTPDWEDAKSNTLPGSHTKGLCTGFGRIQLTNNGEYHPEALTNPRIPAGVLGDCAADGSDQRVIRRCQFTDVTTRDGVYGNERPDANAIWAIGWDHRSVILTTTADGATWHDYRLPKGSHSYDGAHGWNTEWPRIREIGEGEDYLATMHGTFWKFPAGFAPGHAAGVRPRSTYLKVIGDFCRWGDRVVFGCDDHAKSEFLNVRALKGKRPAARPSESNLWFVEPGRLDALGPCEGKGAAWAGDAVAAGQASDPFLFAGYDRTWLWLTVTAELQVDEKGDGKWASWKELAPGGHDLASAPRGEWVRLVARAASTNAFAVFHCTSAAGSRVPRDRVFALPAPAEAAAVFEDDAPVPQGLILEDAASLVYVDGGVRRRLPRRTAASAATCGRLCREVSTERDLLHVGEIFYELPADNAGGFRYVHPVAATSRQIADYDTWKGCLVLKEADGSLKVGVADDLWALGAPVGVGGPWKDAKVAAGEPSDAYLMNGFGRKTLTLAADADATISLEADIDGNGTWVAAGEFRVKAGKPLTAELPAAFSAYWVRVRADRDCTASAQFVYSAE